MIAYTISRLIHLCKQLSILNNYIFSKFDSNWLTNKECKHIFYTFLIRIWSKYHLVYVHTYTQLPIIDWRMLSLWLSLSSSQLEICEKKWENKEKFKLKNKTKDQKMNGRKKTLIYIVCGEHNICIAVLCYSNKWMTTETTLLELNYNQTQPKHNNVMLLWFCCWLLLLLLINKTTWSVIVSQDNYLMRLWYMQFFRGTSS